MAMASAPQLLFRHHPQAAPESSPVLVPSSGKLLLLAGSLASCRVCFIRYLPVLAHPGFSFAALVTHVADVLLTPSLTHLRGLGRCLIPLLPDWITRRNCLLRVLVVLKQVGMLCFAQCYPLNVAQTQSPRTVQTGHLSRLSHEALEFQDTLGYAE